MVAKSEDIIALMQQPGVAEAVRVPGEKPATLRRDYARAADRVRLARQTHRITKV